MQLHNRSLTLSTRLTEFLALCSKYHQVNYVPVLVHLSSSKICLHKIELTEPRIFFAYYFQFQMKERVTCLTWTLNKMVLSSKLLQPLLCLQVIWIYLFIISLSTIFFSTYIFIVTISVTDAAARTTQRKDCNSLSFITVVKKD